ncbi:MAG TPA: hypothetical protein VMN60_08430 [Longimicrobiales bacterium]|nr:hypothetical protein [Longimicrobiales bacterium]
MRQFLAFVLLMTVTGCDRIDSLGPNFTDDELMLTFRAEGLVPEASAAGQETVTIFDLSTAAAQLVLEQGTRVSDATCDDVIENGGPQVTRSRSAGTPASRPRHRELGYLDNRQQGLHCCRMTRQYVRAPILSSGGRNE